jgi:hypothetical protein
MGRPGDASSNVIRGATVTKADDTKAEHKASAVAMHDKGAYEDTAFGRRRTSRIPKWLAVPIKLVGKPISFIYGSWSNPRRGSK